MRIQVRIGDHYTEIKEHLEQFPQEYRGKRLLLLAAMQLATQGKPILVHESADDSPEEHIKADAVQEAAVPKTRPAPSWITRNVSS